MRLLTREQARRVDQLAQTEYGLSDSELMESAGEAVVRATESRWPRPRNVLVLVGMGNNGGDGWVVARLLREKGVPSVTAIRRNSDRSFSEVWEEKRRRALKAGVVEEVLSAENPRLPLRKFDLAVDGLFGTGLDRPLDPADRRLIELVNQLDAQRVALDLPSGLDADTGEIYGECVEAHLTVSFGWGKPGLYLNYGPRYSGEILCDPIKFPTELLEKEANSCFAVGLRTASRWIPARPNVSNKGSYGHVVLFAGSEKFRGAGILAAQAALRVGAGYVHLIGDGEVYPDLLKIPEVIYHHSYDIPWESWGPETSFVVGPGWAVGGRILTTLETLMERGFQKVVLDAEALNEIARRAGRRWPSSWLMTPHPAELARLMEKKTEDIVSDRLRAVQSAAEKWGCRILLKGFRTVIGDSDRRVIVLAGNSALAKAGSGDVLSGFIGGLLAQSLDTFRGGILASSLHGVIANRWVARGLDPASLTPGDLLKQIPRVLRQARELKLKKTAS